MDFKSIQQAVKQTGLAYLGKVNSSAKLMKNEKVNGQYTYITYLAPANTSNYNVCSHSTPECRIGCLATSGRARVELLCNHNRIKNARIRKTNLFFDDNNFYMQWLIAEIEAYQKKAVKDGMGFSVRLNGTSDIDWAKVLHNGKNIFEIFPNVEFYDYTKNPNKFKYMPKNYHLTFSYTGRNAEVCKALLEQGYNVAVVFNVKKGVPLPAMFGGYNVIDGDLTDYRPSDGKGIIVGLRFKEIANKEAGKQLRQSVFVVSPEEAVTALGYVPECSYA